MNYNAFAVLKLKHNKVTKYSAVATPWPDTCLCLHCTSELQQGVVHLTRAFWSLLISSQSPLYPWQPKKEQQVVLYGGFRKYSGPSASCTSYSICGFTFKMDKNSKMESIIYRTIQTLYSAPNSRQVHRVCFNFLWSEVCLYQIELTGHCIKRHKRVHIRSSCMSGHRPSYEIQRPLCRRLWLNSTDHGMSMKSFLWLWVFPTQWPQ